MPGNRNRWRGTAGAVVIGLATVLVASGPASARGPAPGEAELDGAAVARLVTDFAERAGYPGVAVAITKGDQVVWTAGYGRDSSGAAVTDTTPMPLAPVSKSFTALAVLQLVEAGRVQLDAPVRDYLPDFRIADRRGSSITVRQLLNHGGRDITLRQLCYYSPALVIWVALAAVLNAGVLAARVAALVRLRRVSADPVGPDVPVGVAVS